MGTGMGGGRRLAGGNTAWRSPPCPVPMLVMTIAILALLGGSAEASRSTATKCTGHGGEDGVCKKWDQCDDTITSTERGSHGCENLPSGIFCCSQTACESGRGQEGVCRQEAACKEMGGVSVADTSNKKRVPDNTATGCGHLAAHVACCVLPSTADGKDRAIKSVSASSDGISAGIEGGAQKREAKDRENMPKHAAPPKKVLPCAKTCAADNQKCLGTATNGIPKGMQWVSNGIVSNSGCCSGETGPCEECCPSPDHPMQDENEDTDSHVQTMTPKPKPLVTDQAEMDTSNRDELDANVRQVATAISMSRLDAECREVGGRCSRDKTCVDACKHLGVIDKNPSCLTSGKDKFRCSCAGKCAPNPAVKKPSVNFWGTVKPVVKPVTKGCVKACAADKCKAKFSNSLPKGSQWYSRGIISEKGCCSFKRGPCEQCCPGAEDEQSGFASAAGKVKNNIGVVQGTDAIFKGNKARPKQTLKQALADMMGTDTNPMDLHCFTGWVAYRQSLYDSNWFGSYSAGTIEFEYLEEYARRRFQNYACQSNSNTTATTCQGMQSCEGIEDKQQNLKCWAQNEATQCKCHEEICEYFDTSPERCEATPTPNAAPTPSPAPAPAPAPSPNPSPGPDRAPQKFKKVLVEEKLGSKHISEKIEYPKREFNHSGLVSRESIWAHFARKNRKPDCSVELKNRPNCVSITANKMDPAFMLMPTTKCFLDGQPFAMIPNDIKETSVHLKSSSGPQRKTWQQVDMVFNSKSGAEVLCKSSVESHVLLMGSLAGPCKLHF